MTAAKRCLWLQDISHGGVVETVPCGEPVLGDLDVCYDHAKTCKVCKGEPRNPEEDACRVCRAVQTERAYNALDDLAAAIQVLGAVTIEAVDLQAGPAGFAEEPLTRSAEATDADVLGSTLAGLFRAVLGLPERSAMRRRLVVEMNDALREGEIALRFSPIHQDMTFCLIRPEPLP